MQIPYTALSTTALQGLLEEFVTREGTDYGDRLYSLADKVSHVRRQLEQGRAVIVYDPHSSSCHIVTRDALTAEAAGEEPGEEAGGRGEVSGE